MQDPVVLIEILSPSNARETRANVWAYTSIPSVAEIVLIRSTSIAAEVLRRQSDGSWPGEPQYIDAEGELVLEFDRFPHSVACSLPHEWGRGVMGGVAIASFISNHPADDLM